LGIKNAEAMLVAVLASSDDAAKIGVEDFAFDQGEKHAA
jgi:hypothetical protein